MIVEDEALNALYIASVLEVCGYDIIGVAATAAGALEAAADRVPELVLMDITLRGDVDGIAAARSLQERLDVPILFVTAHADAPTLERARATNPVGYLIKPFTSRQLEEAVEDALANAPARKAGSRKLSDDSRQRQNDDDDYDNADDPEDVSRH
ncbi:response regulator [Rhodospirillaceae bacterium SYSU D60014]|uniref:response regulator n=1 Tax=Virgifigura deserti TaxID=2268457 RepID=UPI0013C488F8